MPSKLPAVSYFGSFTNMAVSALLAKTRYFVPISVNIFI